MKNPHIIVGEGHRCICGLYEDKPITCHLIGSILNRLERLGREDEAIKKDVDVLQTIILSLTEDRPL